MKKYLKLLFVALFATMTLSLTSCNSDEPDGAPSKGNLDKYYFTVNGKKYYYAYDFYSMDYDINSGVVEFDETSRYEKDVIRCTVKGFNKVISFDDFAIDAFKPFKEGSGITEFAGFNIYLDGFDYSTAKEGQELQITDFTTYYEAHSGIGINYVQKNGSLESISYGWPTQGSIKGKVTFVSYKDNYLTLKFDNIEMQEEDGNSIATLSGTIVYNVGESVTLP